MFSSYFQLCFWRPSTLPPMSCKLTGDSGLSLSFLASLHASSLEKALYLPSQSSPQYPRSSLLPPYHFRPSFPPPRHMWQAPSCSRFLLQVDPYSPSHHSVLPVYLRGGESLQRSHCSCLPCTLKWIILKGFWSCTGWLIEQINYKVKANIKNLKIWIESDPLVLVWWKSCTTCIRSLQVQFCHCWRQARVN